MIDSRLSLSELKQHISYDAGTGMFAWVKSASGRLMDRSAGSIASDGYVIVYICGRRYQAHHLAWLFVYGVWPTQIDHINRERADNRIANLREANRSQNQHNKTRPSNNTSGHKGIRFKKNRWEASCMVRGMRKYLGRYIDREDAINAYNSFAAQEVGEFHLPTEGEMQ